MYKYRLKGSHTGWVDKSKFDYLQGHSQASAGPKPVLSGMRKSYWGKDAYVIMCCDYAFVVSEQIFRELMQI